MLCPSCLGHGLQTSGEVCETCKGQKEIPQARCPNSSLEGRDGVAGFDAYAFFKNYKILPCAGGLNDQTQYFLNLLAFCDKVHSALDERQEERNETMRSLADKTRKPAAKARGK